MGEKGPPRKPATKLPHLRKKMTQIKIRAKAAKSKRSLGAR
jgi:hypothetical protein